MIECDRCGTAVDIDAVATGMAQTCRGCGARLRVEAFPALLRSREVGAAAQAAIEGEEATCYEHQTSRAVAACDRCGRFLCALCDLPWHDQHLCPACLDRAAAGDQDPSLVVERTRWDRIALSLAVLPILTCYFTLLTAPLTLALVWKFRKAPRSLVSPGGWRFRLAAVIASVELLVWGSLVVMLAGSIVEAQP